jgi:hypothetical protein
VREDHREPRIDRQLGPAARAINFYRGRDRRLLRHAGILRHIAAAQVLQLCRMADC